MDSSTPTPIPHAAPHGAPPPALLLVGSDGAALRATFRTLLGEARQLDLALTRVRLDTLGSIPDELDALDRVRIVLGELRAEALDAEAHSLAVGASGRSRLRRLARLVGGGRVEVRAAPLAGWSPDFSIFPGASGRGAAMVGSHAFGRGGGLDGPVQAVVLRGGGELDRLGEAFSAIWARAHEVTPAIETVLRRALRWSSVPRVAERPGAPGGTRHVDRAPR